MNSYIFGFLLSLSLTAPWIIVASMIGSVGLAGVALVHFSFIFWMIHMYIGDEDL